MTIFRACFQAITLWLGLLIQASFVSSLGDPWAAFPILLAWGIAILHERSIVWGVWWLVLSGLMLEWRGLGFGLSVAYLGAAIATALLVTSVFAKRSLAGLYGVSLVATAVFLFFRLLGMIIWNLIFAEPWNLSISLWDFLFVIITVPLTVVAISMVRRRFFFFAQDLTVRRNSPYEIL